MNVPHPSRVMEVLAEASYLLDLGLALQGGASFLFPWPIRNMFQYCECSRSRQR